LIVYKGREDVPTCNRRYGVVGSELSMKIWLIFIIADEIPGKEERSVDGIHGFRERFCDRVLKHIVWWALRYLGMDEWIVIKATYEEVMTLVKENERERVQYDFQC
jgi:hypothetical protein